MLPEPRFGEEGKKWRKKARLPFRIINTETGFCAEKPVVLVVYRRGES